MPSSAKKKIPLSIIQPNEKSVADDKAIWALIPTKTSAPIT